MAIYHNLLPGGSKKVLYDFVKYFKSDFDIDVYQLTSSEDTFYNFDNYISNKYVYNFAPLFSNWFTNPYLYTPAILADYFRIVRLAKTIGEKMDENEYEFVFINHDRYIQNPVIPKYTKHKSVFYIQEPFRFFYEPQFDVSQTKPFKTMLGLFGMVPVHWLLKTVNCIGVRHSDIILANSLFTRESIYKAYGVWSDTAYMGIETEKYGNKPVKKENFVLSIGAINWRKGHKLAIDGLSVIPQKERPRLIIISPNVTNKTEEAFIKKHAKGLGVALDIHKNISDEELVAFYNKAIATVCTSIMEPFGLVPLESMACGTPVIAVQEGGFRETIVHGKTGYLIPRDSKSLAEKILEVKNSGNKNYSDACEKYVQKNWDWSTRYPELIGLIQKKLQTRSI